MQSSVNVVARSQSVHIGHHGRENLALLFLRAATTEHHLKPRSLFLGELALALVALDQVNVGLLSVSKAHRWYFTPMYASRRSILCNSFGVS